MLLTLIKVWLRSVLGCCWVWLRMVRRLVVSCAAAEGSPFELEEEQLSVGSG